MTYKKDLFERTIKTHGFSMTKSRRHVYETLANNGALSMNRLCSLTTVDRASIYRAICLFEQIGIIHRVYTGWKYTIELSDKFDYHHHHASCVDCGSVISLTEHEELETAIKHVSEKYQFKVTSHQVELSGFCENCQLTSSL